MVKQLTVRRSFTLSLAILIFFELHTWVILPRLAESSLGVYLSSHYSGVSSHRKMFCFLLQHAILNVGIVVGRHVAIELESS